MEQWIPRYETLSRLDERSLFLIGDRLKRFLDDFGPLSWPLNCFHLLYDIQASRRIRLTVYESSEPLPGADAAATFDPETGRYFIRFTRTPKDWQSRSRYRRNNFTVAHELGHIFLGHLDIPYAKKSDALRDREDMEADEFASRLLMPEELMRSACFASLPSMAAAFLVSEQACFHRMNNLRLLDRLNQPPAECPECGNRRISPCASWCRMCGASLGRNIPEKTALMMSLPFQARCPVCGSGVPAGGGECPDCGYPRNNPCQAEYDQPHHPNLPDARFCETCGAATLYPELARIPFVTRDMPLWQLFRASPAGKQKD